MLESESLEEIYEAPGVVSPEISMKSPIDNSGSGKRSILFFVSENQESDVMPVFLLWLFPFINLQTYFGFLILQ